MAQGMRRVTKEDLLEVFKRYNDQDFVGVIFSACRDLKEPQHDVLVFYDALEKF